MKKIFPLLISLSFFISVNAQIVIDFEDIPVPGTIITQTSDTTPSGTLPVFTTGSNVNWDFTSLNNQVPATTAFIDPSTTPYCSSFPTATLCYITADSSIFGYIFNNSSYVVTLGARAIMDTNEIIMKYNPYDTLFVFPMSMGTSFESHPCGVLKYFYGDSINFGLGNIYIDSMRLTICYDKNTVVDGWGNVTTPLGTYPVLKSTRTEIEEREVAMRYMNIWIPVNTTKDTSLVIEWNMKNAGVPLITIKANPADSSFSLVNWLTVPPNLGLNEMDNNNSLNIYPNPADDEITVSFEGETPEFIIVSDVYGHEVKKIVTNNKPMISINVNDLSYGVYFISSAKRGETFVTGRFIKQ